MPQDFNLRGKEKSLRRALTTLPYTVGVLAVNFSKERFRAGGWLDSSFQPWKPRNPKAKRNNGRGLLIDTGRLRRSIRVTEVSPGSVTIGTNVPYARAHNEGFSGEVVQSVKAFTRKKTKFGVAKTKTLKTRTNIEFGRVQIGSINVKAHTRTIKQNIPQRQFMGDSAHLRKIIGRKINTEIMKALS